MDIGPSAQCLGVPNNACHVRMHAVRCDRIWIHTCAVFYAMSKACVFHQRTLCEARIMTVSLGLSLRAVRHSSKPDYMHGHSAGVEHNRFCRCHQPRAVTAATRTAHPAPSLLHVRPVYPTGAMHGNPQVLLGLQPYASAGPPRAVSPM